MCGPVAVELDRLAGGDGAREVGALHRGLGGDPLARLGLAGLGGEDPAPHRAAVADVAHERPRVDAGDRRTPQSASQSSQPPSAVGRVLAVLRLAHDHRAGVDAVGLHRLGADAVVADQRVGEGDDLARVGGVGDRLLVAGHRGVEDDLAGDRRRAAPQSSPSRRVPSSSRT